MSLAREISKKLDKRKQAKGEPGLLPLENPVQPSTESDQDPGRVDQPEKEGPLFNKPIAIESRHLDRAIVYLVKDEIMASEAEKQGLIAFTTEEIKVMGALERSMGKEQWISHLKAVYQTKKIFEGSRVIR
jgi:hypothetical protein